jgi:predicted RNA methylase
MGLMTYKIIFDRIGRTGGRNGSKPPEPITVDSENADEIAEEVYRYARRFLASREVEVIVNLGKGTGFISAGFSNAGSFKVEAVPA